MEDRVIRTSVTVPESVWRLLRGLAEKRALREGGKPNASAVVAELVERESTRETEASRG